LKGFLKQKERVEKALYRCQKSIDALDAFQHSVHVRHVPASSLSDVQRTVGLLSEELDNKLVELEGRMEKLSTDIADERRALLGDAYANSDDGKLGQRVSITIVAEKDCIAEIVLIYGACFVRGLACFFLDNPLNR